MYSSFQLLLCLLGLVAMCTGHGEETDLTYTTAFGVIRTPDFPHSYPDNMEHTYTIKVTRGYKVVLYFSAFDIEESYGDGAPCVTDFLEVYDGPVSKNNSMGKLCGRSEDGRSTAPTLWKQKIESTGNTLSLRMVSDYSNQLGGDLPSPTGFRAHYFKQDRNECAEQRLMDFDSYEEDTTCKGFCNNYPGGFYCSCDVGYTLHADGTTCVAPCAEVPANPTSGFIDSPGFPNAYSTKTHCKWRIEGEAGKNVHLTFDSAFDVEAYPDNTCPYDYVKVTDYFGSRGTFCGNQLPMLGNEIVSTTNWVEVEFHSDSSVTGGGFQMYYEMRGTECQVPDPPMRGMISHPESSVTTVPFGGYILFKCEEGYRMFGSHKTVCLKDGSLSDKTPKCVGF